ncbi:MAG: LacI family DNA-binding transcriptional regulator [Spirochaetota bacterium]
MATLKDIAESVGVSVRTVTRALSGDGYVRADLRDEIRRVAEQTGYRPDPLARSLRLGRTREIIVVSPSVDELHMARIASLEQRVRPTGHSVAVVMASTSELRSDSLVAEIRSRKPAGVAAVGGPGLDLSALVNALYSIGVPCIPIDSPTEYPGVEIDRPAGVAEATEYLIAHDRRCIVYAGPSDSKNRLDGFCAAMERNGREALAFDPGAARSRDEFAAGLLDRFPGVDAVQAYSDEWALELLAGLHARGVRVPGDVALIGFDDRWAAAHSWPALTTVAQPGERIGVAVAELLTGEQRRLLDPLLDRDCPRETVRRLGAELTRRIPTELVVRESA